MFDDFQEYVNAKAQEFDELCVERHRLGAEEYGTFTFLGNDVVRMMLEELADTSNYCRMQGIKLLLLQEVLEQQLDFDGIGNVNDEENQNLQIGFESFKGTKDGWNK